MPPLGTSGSGEVGLSLYIIATLALPIIPASLRRIVAKSLRRQLAILNYLFQQLAELGCVPMAVNRDRMLHGDFDEFTFTVCGYRDRAFAVRRHLPAIDIFPCHNRPLRFETQRHRGSPLAPAADFLNVLGVVTGTKPVGHDHRLFACGWH